jgi:8-oxo-dGTP diphosphatase
MQIPRAAFAIIKEAARHLLRRPVVGIVVFAQTRDGRVLLIRRGDTGRWAMPGGTLEWGETLESCTKRELSEETGAEVITRGELLGVYSHPDRDFRFHAVTIVVSARVTPPLRPPKNPLEILEVRLFEQHELPSLLSHDMTDMLRNATEGKCVWE